MAITLNQADNDFEARFATFLTTKREVSADVDLAVRQIIDTVRADGDDALRAYSLKFDRADLSELGIAVSREDIERAYEAADSETVEALKFARDRIHAHHRRQRPQDDRYTDPIGVELGSRWTAIESAGNYNPVVRCDQVGDPVECDGIGKVGMDP